MDYKKKYNEALRKIRELIERGKENRWTITAYEKDFEEIFPELKESEGEKVNRILHSISSKMGSHLRDIFTEEEFQCFDAWSNAWLEKQGEPNPYSGVSFTYNGHTWGMCARDNGVDILFDCKLIKYVDVEKQGDTDKESYEITEKENNVNEETNAPTGYGKYIDECLNEAARHFFSEGEDKYCVADLFYAGVRCGQSCPEKQGSQILANSAKTYKDVQKPTNKVKPRFKVGDWIVNRTDATIMQVVNNKDFYESVEINGQRRTDTYNYIEWDFRLWTIEDAKDGDVLYSEGLYGDCIFIFNGLDKWKFDAPNGERAIATGHCCLTLNDMDFGIQGPDCIEVNTVKPATKEQRDLLFKAMTDAGWKFDFEKKELKEIKQKSAWSEEDERKLNWVINVWNRLRRGGDAQTTPSQMKMLEDWLKSLKERIGG